MRSELRVAILTHPVASYCFVVDGSLNENGRLLKMKARHQNAYILVSCCLPQFAEDEGPH